MILSGKRITKALISLPGCAGWSVSLLFANPGQQVLSQRGPYYFEIITCDPSIYTMDHPDFILSNFMESFIGVKMVKCCSLSYICFVKLKC